MLVAAVVEALQLSVANCLRSLGTATVSLNISGPLTTRAVYLSVMSEGQRVVRAARHLHHSLALQLGCDQRRRQGWKVRGRPHLTVAVVAPSKELPVCSGGHKPQRVEGKGTTTFSSAVYIYDEYIRYFSVNVLLLMFLL